MLLGIELRHRSIIAGAFFALLVGLGIFVNALFLVVALASLCGLVHLFGGHHGGAAHKHDQVLEEKKINVNGS